MAVKNRAILAGWKSARVWVTLRPLASLKNGEGGRQGSTLDFSLRLRTPQPVEPARRDTICR
jgi:hypothetical protein